MTDKEILKLAETCGADRHISKITNDIYWECDEDDLLKFALIMYNKGICEGAYQQSKRYMEGVFDDD